MHRFRFLSEASGNCYIFNLSYFIYYFIFINPHELLSATLEPLTTVPLALPIHFSTSHWQQWFETWYLTDFSPNQNAVEEPFLVGSHAQIETCTTRPKNARSHQHSSYWGASSTKPWTQPSITGTARGTVSWYQCDNIRLWRYMRG